MAEVEENEKVEKELDEDVWEHILSINKFQSINYIKNELFISLL